MDLETRINRGKEAARLLGEPVLLEALESLRGSYVKDWECSAPNDKDERERTFMKISVLREIKSEISSFVNDGKISENKLKRQIL